MSKSRKGKGTMLSTSPNKWLNRKRNKTGTEDDKFSPSVKQRRIIQQNKPIVSKDESSDSDDSDSNEETFFQKDKTTEHKHTDHDKMKHKSLTINDSSESDTDTESESDVNDNEKNVQRQENKGFSGSSSDVDDSDSDSDDDSEFKKRVNLKVDSSNVKVNVAKSSLSKSKLSGIEKSHNKTSFPDNEDSLDSSGSDDDSDDDDDEDELKTSSKAEINPASGKQLSANEIISVSDNKKDRKKVDSDSSSSEDDVSSDSSEVDDDSDEIEEDKDSKKELHSGTKTEVVPVKTVNKDHNMEKGQNIDNKGFATKDDDNTDSGDDSDVSDDAHNTDDYVDEDGNEVEGDEGTETAENYQIEDEFAAVKRELADIPLEDLMKVKEKLGLKMFNRIMHGDKFEEKKRKVFTRANKNRPMEISSKKRIAVARHTDIPKEKVRRDPRFDDLSGEFQDKHFMRNYSFLDDVKSKEKLLVQKKMMKTKDENKKKELEKLLSRMNQQEHLEKQKRHRLELEQQWKQKEKQMVKEGKTPYFLKKSDKKKLELADKYKELQKSGKVDQYMSKKMKKNAKKEKKKLPGRHERFM